MDPKEPNLEPADLLVHDGWVRALARRLVYDPSEAEELVQETWLAALKSPPDPSRPPRPWLARVLRNSMRARARSRSARQWHESEKERDEKAPVDPAQLIEQVEAQGMVAAELLGLPEPFRTTVLQRYYEGLSSAEIARRENIPPGTVRWRLKRGLDLMRRSMDMRTGDRKTWCTWLAPLAIASGMPQGGGAPAILRDLGYVTASRVLGVLVLLGVGVYGVQSTTGPVEHVAPTTPTTLMPAVDAPELVHTHTVPQEPEAREVVPTGTTALAPSPVASPPDDQEPPPVVRTSRVAARLVDESGATLSEGRLQLEHAGARASVSVGADGFAATDIDRLSRPRIVRATLSAPGHACSVLELRLVPGEERDLGDVALSPAGHISGRIHDEDGQPLANAIVVACHADLERRTASPPELPPCSRLARSDDHGDYVIPCAPTGPTRIWAWTGDVAIQVSEAFDLQADEPITGIDFVMEDPTAIRGRITDAAGHESGIRVAWRKEVGLRSPSASEVHHARFVGGFRIDTGRPGPIELLAYDPARGLLLEQTLTAPAHEIELIVTQPAPRVRVTARDPHGTVVPEIAVNATHADWDLTLFHAQGPGHDLAVPCPTPGRLEIHAAGFRPATIDPGTRGRVEIELIPWTLTPGTVTEANGAPAANVRVALYAVTDPEGSFDLHGIPLERARHPSATTRTDAEGRFHLPRLDGGPYVVRAERADRPAAEHTLFWNERADLVFPIGGSLTGNLARDHADPPLWIVASRGDHRPRRMLLPANGDFAFQGLEPGSWSLYAVDNPPPLRLSSITEQGQGFRSRHDDLGLPNEPFCTVDVRDGETTQASALEYERPR
tara:strand:+ start:2824 stop:5346 length:2523 start_codon:yes stop_codon:yes gene_type:complete